MPKFEFVPVNDAPPAPALTKRHRGSTSAPWERDMQARVDAICDQYGVPPVPVQFFYNVAKPARERRRRVSLAYGRQLYERYGPDRVYRTDSPEAYWYRNFYGERPASQYTSGHYYSYPKWMIDTGERVDHINLRVGTDREYAFFVLLHEVGHYLTHRLHGQGHSHDETFWRVAFDLYDENGIDRAFYIANENQYRKEAGRVAAKTGRV